MVGDKEKSQIDLYDIYGYLVPGTFLFISSLCALASLHGYTIPVILREIRDLNVQSFVALAIVLLVVSYIVGHLAATLSSIVFDRIFVNKIFRFPSENLLGYRSQEGGTDEDYYRVTIFVWLSVSGLFAALPLFGKFQLYVVNGLSLVMLLSLFKLLKSVRESRSESKSKKSRVSGCWNSGGFKLFMRIAAFPFRLFEVVFRNFFGFDKCFSPMMRRFIRHYVTERFGASDDEQKTGASEIYWLCYWCVAERSAHFRDRLNKFISLYAMTRNSAASLWLASVFCSVANYVNDKHSIHMAYAGFVLLVIAVVLSVRYYYLYFNYYSRLVYYALVVLDHDAEINNLGSDPVKRSE